LYITLEKTSKNVEEFRSIMRYQVWEVKQILEAGRGKPLKGACVVASIPAKRTTFSGVIVLFIFQISF
jgi:hypothetical protein